MPKLTISILTISLVLSATSLTFPVMAAQNQLQTNNITNHQSNIALAGKKCAAKRFYSRPHRR